MTQQTQQRDIERLLDGWFEAGPSRASDRVLVVVADRIGRQPQRPAWLVGWQRPDVATPVKFALLAAALVAAAVGGALLVAGRPPSITVPNVRPSAQPGFPCDDSSPCAGNLAAGTHRSSVFQPIATYDVPTGWRNIYDGPSQYSIDSLDIPAPRIDVVTLVAIPEQGPNCSGSRRQGVGNRVQDWVSFFTTHPGLVASESRTVAVGGQRAVQVTVKVAPTWKEECGIPPEPGVVLLTNSGGDPSRYWWIGSSAVTFTMIDVGGETVMVVVESRFPEIHQRQMDFAMPVIETFRFGGG